MPKLDATPDKRSFLAIITEYDLKRSICELIDNAIDLWTKSKADNLKIELNIDHNRQTISIEDNSGGVEESKLDYLVSPGKTTNEVHDDVIGYFGVGSKRAVIALAEDISILSRYGTEKTFSVRIDDDWINYDPLWTLEYTEAKRQLTPNTTLIELFKLRTPITNAEVSQLRKDLSEIYGRFIEKGVEISLNKERLPAVNFDSEWCFPPEFKPKTLKTKIDIEDRAVDVEITCGLLNHAGDPDNSYGVFIYCNDRLITRGQTDFNMGFSSGLIGNPHYNISLVRTVVKLKGQSRDMPWDTSKSGINPRHPLFHHLRVAIISITKSYVQVCRALQGRWDQEVFAFPTGTIEQEISDSIGSIPKQYFPTPPASKPRWYQKVTKRNAELISKKPWTAGLQDSIIAADAISKMSLSQKNRIALILIDSTLEIAYKEYLVNEREIGRGDFNKLTTRESIQKEVLKTIRISPETVKQINHYYILRNDLIHQRVTPNIGPEQVLSYRSIVEDLLNRMFGLNFTE